MRRRLDLAISLIVRPPVVFLDEPTTGLDTRSRQELWEVIRGLRDDGTTVLLTTQYLEEADRLADRIAVLDHGRIVAEGTAAELKARTGGEVVELHDDDGNVIAERPTDGTIDGLRRRDRRAAARTRRGTGHGAQADPRRRIPRPHRRSDTGGRMTTITSASARPLRPFTEEGVFLWRSLLHSLRNAEALLMSIMLPVMLMLLFTFVFGGAIDSTGGYVNYVVPGIILLCAGFGAASTAVEVANDLDNGIIDRFRSMPIRSWAVLTGHVDREPRAQPRRIGARGRGRVRGRLPHRRRPCSSGSASSGLIALWILAITYLFAAIGLAAGSAEAASGYGFILLFLPYLSSAFVPVDTLPSWLQWIAEQPARHPDHRVIRALLTGTDAGTAPWFAVGWCLLILAIAVVWGAVMFRRKAGRGASCRRACWRRSPRSRPADRPQSPVEVRGDADARGALDVLDQVVGEEGILRRRAVPFEHPLEHHRIGLARRVGAGCVQVLAEQLGRAPARGRRRDAGARALRCW